jgi:mono/diheme cytochrome c family protein
MRINSYSRTAKPFLKCGLTLLLLLLCSSSPLIAQDRDPATAYLILKEKCFACHGGKPAEIKGGLNLTTREQMLAGGELWGAALVPGKPANSPLFSAVKRDDESLLMPPKENDKLSLQQIATLERWIKAGAAWPTDAEIAKAIKEGWASEGVVVKTNGGLSDEWTLRRYDPDDIWAWQPRKEIALPTSAANHPIDRFINRKITETGLEPSPPADKRTWLRRVSFDLTGLPPSPSEMEAFLADDSENAKEKVIESLLDSKAYGERMAQHWLDVVRYADTAGFANDWERPNAWRYRDYVIRSFNADKPYDQFILEQLAGDELKPNDPEMKVAVGYLRMGPWEHTAMSVAAVTRQQFLDDVTNSVGVTFLGMELRCCSCHDHKFDPLPTRDYYRVQAVFATTQFDEANAGFLPGENTADFDKLRRRLVKMQSDKDWIKTDDNGNDSRRRVAKKRDDYLDRALKRDQSIAFSVKSAGGEKTHILHGGSIESPGDAVAPGTLSALQFGDEKQTVSAIPSSSDGRRLALAKWIAHPDNPLAARVMVNRVWQMHFGRGLVKSSNNFGKMGSRPTHPELLDWLANWFVSNGWSLKKLHHLIVTSDVYARSSRSLDPKSLAATDPSNNLLSAFPPRRLSAEEIRDAVLLVTGELSSQRGGPGIYPEINWEVALQPRHIMGSIAPAYQPSPTPAERNRRSVYIFRIRTLADPTQEVFNKPGPDLSCERRDETTVTPQVFALFNSVDMQTRSLALAQRLNEELPGDLDAQIRRGFQLCYAREPSEEEFSLSRKHVEKMRQLHQKAEASRPAARRELPKYVKRNMIDEQTGLPFAWEEKLHGMFEYEPDVQPADVDANTRAIADFCLVLLNSNEFLFVY